MWVIVFFLIFILLNTWENEKTSRDKLKTDDKPNYSNITNKLDEFIEEDDQQKSIIVNTDLVFAKINLFGGNIIHLSFKKYFKDPNNCGDNITVLDEFNRELLLIRSGFFDKFDSLKFKNYFYSSHNIDYNIERNGSILHIVLKYKIDSDIFFCKIYTFKNYSYDIDVDFYIKNESDKIYSGKLCGFIKQKQVSSSGGFLSFGAKDYNNGALHTDTKLCKKVSFDEVFSKNFIFTIKGGWIAMLGHYFLSAWIPGSLSDYIYTVKKVANNFFVLEYVSDEELVILPGECKCLESKLFVGPKIKSFLTKMHTGLDLTIDYGMLWPIAGPIFLLLSKIYSFIKNWGISIILITFVIKLLFFHLSSLSYRSMGNIKRLQPRLNILKERYKDNKKEFSQAVMDLYKKENINPLSGCLPILIQIPVFISLYYVLLESVELRHASFFLWINDLSEKDSYYILPIIMCLTMFLQQYLNPSIQDPLQAKIMMFIPLIFLFIFSQFPSGLILYWVVNNVLSIFQQWIIVRHVSLS